MRRTTLRSSKSETKIETAATSRAVNAFALALGSLAAVFATVPAFAQAAPQGAPPALMQFIPFIFLFVVMYFLMIRPQAKRQKAHQEFLSKLKRGDEVVTASGIFCRIEGLTEQFVTLEIAPDVRIKVVRSQVASSVAAATSGSEVKA